MGDYIVTAILTAKDKNFTSTFNNANSATESLGAKLKAGIGFGAFAGIGMKAVSAVGSGLKSLVTDLNSTTSSWSSFSKNMAMSGMKNDKIETTKKDLQDFAKKTVYTSKDMAATYAQLYAVNKKTSTSLVKGFGAVAAAAENPTQAMKTLSTQATQMAAKPTVQWQDFKLMLEQTPAGISKVAQAMNMSTTDLVANVQDGKIATQDFFDAMEKLASDPDLMGMATTYKTIGEAADGLSATLATGLAPAWEVVNDVGIDAVTKLMGVASKGIKGLKKAFKGVGKQFKETANALETLGGSLMSNKESMTLLKNTANAVGKAIKLALKAVEVMAEKINKLVKAEPKVVDLGLAFLGINTAVKKVTGSGVLGGLAKKLWSPIKSAMTMTKTLNDGMGDCLEEMSKTAGTATEAVGESMEKGASSVKTASETIGEATSSMGEKATEGAKGLEDVAGKSATTSETVAQSGSKFLQAAVGFMAIATAILLAAAGFWILSQAAVTLSEGGGLAIGIFTGMVVGIGLLALAFAKLGPQLDVAIPAMLTFGATVLMVGAGIALIGVGVYLACAGITKLAGVLPQVAENGTGAGKGLLALAGGLLAVIAVIAIAGVVLVALGTFSGVAATGIGVLAAAGIVVIGIMMGFAFACKLVKTQVQGIATQATIAAKQLKSMVSSINIVKAGLCALKSLASSAISALKSAFSGSTGALKSSATAMGQAVSNGLKSGLTTATNNAKTAVNHIKTALHSGVSAARTVGVNIGKGLANGIRDEIPAIKAAAKAASEAATVKMKKTSKEHSPSRVTQKIGKYLSQGLIIGMESEKRNISRVSGKLAELATYSPSRLSYAGDYSLNDSWDYSSTANYEITVVSELDGKVVSRQLAPTMQQEQNRLNNRSNRKRGIR